MIVSGDCRHFELLSDPGRAILGWDKQTRREACVKMVPALVEPLRRTRKLLPLNNYKKTKNIATLIKSCDLEPNTVYHFISQ